MTGILPPDGRRGVTPVVGIVLLVALTILIAGTVAAFVFTMEDDVEGRQAPTTALDFEFDKTSSGSDALTIVHRSGDAIATSLLYVQIEGADCVGGGADPNRRLNVGADWGLSGELTAGMTIRVSKTVPGSANLCTTGNLDLSGATIRVVWESGTGTSRELQTWYGPGS